MEWRPPVVLLVEFTTGHREAHARESSIMTVTWEAFDRMCENAAIGEWIEMILGDVRSIGEGYGHGWEVVGYSEDRGGFEHFTVRLPSSVEFLAVARWDDARSDRENVRAYTVAFIVASRAAGIDPGGRPTRNRQ